MKDSEDQDELALSHLYINTIHATLQGRYTRLNAARQLGLLAVSDAEMNACVLQLQAAKAAFDSLRQGRIDSLLEEPLSPGAIKLLALHRELQQELQSLVPHLRELLEELKTSNDRGVQAEVAVYVAGRAYTRQHYVQGLVAYCEAFSLDEQADRYRQHLLHSQEEIRVASYFFQVLMEQEVLAPDQQGHLVEESLLLAGLYACQAHDFSVNEVRRGCTESYTLFGITETASAQWQAEGFAPIDAAYWDAHEFAPSDAGIWRQIGFANSAEAASWRKHGFEASGASLMAMAGLSPRAAAQKAAQHQESTRSVDV